MSSTWAQTLEAVGRYAIRYSLVLVLLWIGGMKFTAYEAEGISGFVSNSPLMSWAYSIFSVRTFSALLGITEIVIGSPHCRAAAFHPRLPSGQRVGHRHVPDHVELSAHDPGRR